MPKDHRDEGIRELRVEGWGLFLVGAFFLAALAGAFYVGRWIERGAVPQAVEPSVATMPGGPSPLAVRPEPEDVSSGADYFDTVAGGEKEAEPRREIPREAAPEAAPPPTEAVEEGRFHVQVFALRDRDSAERVVKALSDKGFAARMTTDTEGGGLYKIRVVGFATRAEAEEMAEQLRAEGYPGAWVP